MRVILLLTIFLCLFTAQAQTVKAPTNDYWIGLYINIDEKFIADMNKSRKQIKPENFAEVLVNYNGKEKRYTLKEFTNLLGFKDEKTKTN